MNEQAERTIESAAGQDGRSAPNPRFEKRRPTSTALVVYFATRRAELEQETKQQLRHFSRALVGNNHSLSITGHTDSRGPAVLNERLSEARARAVAGYLRKRGIAAERIVELKGRGSRQPISASNNEQAWSLNRRVEVKLLHDGRGTE